MILHRLLAGSVAAATLLSASPAYALFYNTNADGSIRIHMNTQENTNNNDRNARASTDFRANTSLSSGMMIRPSRRCLHLRSGDSNADCRALLRAQSRVNTSTGASVNNGRDTPDSEFDRSMRIRFDAAMRRIFTAIRSLALQACTREHARADVNNTNATTSINTCMADLKASIQTRVNAMIDAAFAMN